MTNTLEIICPKEPDMEGEWDRKEIEDEIREIFERAPEENEWIEWIMSHDDVGDYFSQKIIDVVCMPEFKSGTFAVDGVDFTIIKS